MKKELSKWTQLAKKALAKIHENIHSLPEVTLSQNRVSSLTSLTLEQFGAHSAEMNPYNMTTNFQKVDTSSIFKPVSQKNNSKVVPPK